MTATKLAITPLSSKAAQAQLSHAAKTLYFGTKPLAFASPCLCSWQQQHGGFSSRASAQQTRHFSSTPRSALKVKQWFPPPETSQIKFAGPAWPHPVYTEEQMEKIHVEHREARTWQDKLALGLMRLARWGMDLATGYAESPPKQPIASSSSSSDAKVKEPWLKMSERKWLIRIVFLESVAGVPGMVGGMLRHLHSLRRMKRDNGWIETLLEEAYNERMHLLTFLKIAEPGWFMKVMILGAQGVFFNGMFLAYLLSPATCHRFVGYLEEEAVYTYSRIIREIDEGRLPKWSDPNYQIPDIAVNYWNIPEGKRTMRDLMMYVRADEAKHREVNHTLGNLEQKNDPNPFISTYEDESKPHPSKGIENTKGTGWERKEVI